MITFLPWQQAGAAPSYHANAVHFDGASDYLYLGSGLTGAADSKLMTVSFWIKVDSDDTTLKVLTGGLSPNMNITRDDNNGIGFFAPNGPTLNADSSADSIEVSNGWVHVLASFNMADTGERHIYVNDVSDLTVSVYNDNEIDFTFSEWAVGARSDGVQLFDGDMADLLIWPGVYVDLSVEADRRLFIDENGKPVDPAVSIGSLGTPIIALYGETATWHTNQGSGGGFTENGALTAASTSPSD